MKQSESLYTKLKAYGRSDFYPYHMPGHKRNVCQKETADLSEPLSHIRNIDITEIEGFDNLHHAQGILKDAQEYAARAYGAKHSYYLVGGSTVGILTAVSALIPSGGRILIARNCHKSVYHAIFLKGLEVSYLQPQLEESFGVPLAITQESVRQALEVQPDIKAVLITSPTYEGLAADIEAIADAVHEKGILLIVDEAHGAHFGFSEYLPKSAVAYADVVIQSTHKTTKALTQTALLHVCSDRVNAEEIQKYLDIYMTSSPSYVLMASIEEAVSELTEHGSELFECYMKSYRDFQSKMEQLKHLQVLKQERQDICKLVIGGKDIFFSGQWLYDVLLEQYHLQMELCQAGYVLAIMTPYDRQEGFDRLFEALRQIDEKLDAMQQPDKKFLELTALQGQGSLYMMPSMLPRQEMSLEEAWHKGVLIPLEQSEGYICSEFVYQYPPGTPIMVPGEAWSEAQIAYVKRLCEMGYQVLGIEKGRVYVKENENYLHNGSGLRE